MGFFKTLAASAALLALSAGAAFAQAPPSDPEGVLVSELVVSAKLPGPAWWKVSDADTTVYVMAVPSLAPKDLAFDTSVLERRLEGADRLILPPQVELHPFRLVTLILTGHKRFLSPQPMSQTLPPELRARLHARLAAIGDKPDEMDDIKPAFAGFILANSGGGSDSVSVELSGVSDTVEKIAKGPTLRARPRVQKLNGYDLPNALTSLANLPPEQQQLCLDDGLRQAESGRGGIRESAERWARGDAEAYSLTDRGFSRCLANTPQIAAQIRAGIDASTRAITSALKKPGKSVALVEFRPLLAQGGVLDRLRAAGFKVETPE